MAGNIKGITIEFRGETTKLDKALRQVQNETRAIDKELQTVNKALKFNPTNIDLWRQKQQLLEQKISETGDKLDLLKKKQAELDAKNVDKNSAEYRTLQREIIETESKLKTFKGQLKQIGNVKLKALSEQVKAVGSNIENAGQKMRGLSAAGAAVAASIGALAYKSGQWADDLNTLSKRYSLSTEELQKYGAAADLVDVSVETIAKSHLKLEKSMASASKGTGSQAEAFEKLGVSVTDADGNLRDSDTVWQEAIAALGTMSNETERDALAMTLMGKSAADLNPLIEDGGETYKQVADTFAKYNLDVIDQETLDKANEFNDQIDTIKAMGLIAFQTIGTQLAGYLAPALEKVVDLVGKFAEWVSNLDPRVVAIVGSIGAVLAVVAPLLIGIGKLAFAISSIISLVGTVGPALSGIGAILTGPVAIAIAAAIAAGVLLYKNWDKIKAFAINLKETVVATFNQFKAQVVAIWNNVKSAVQMAVSSLVSGAVSKFNAFKAKVSSTFNAVKNAIMTPIKEAVRIVKSAIDKIKSIINGAKLKLPHFDLPHFKIYGGKLPWGIGGKGTPPSIDVKWYARGGIFDSPTIAGVGDVRGGEAVVPLNKFWDKLDRIAEASTGGGITINVYGTAGQSPRQIAEEVRRVLIAEVKRDRLAWQ